MSFGRPWGVVVSSEQVWINTWEETCLVGEAVEAEAGHDEGGLADGPGKIELEPGHHAYHEDDAQPAGQKKS